MKEQIFHLLKEQYDKDGTILSAGILQEKMLSSCAAEDWIEGIYLFDMYLNEQHAAGKKRK